MSSPATASIYSVDSSSLMDWQGRFYPTDVFAELLTKMEDLIAARRFLAPVQVRQEVEAVGTQGLKDWVGHHRDLFVPTAETLTETQAIRRQFAGLLDPKAEYEEADAYVIALAKIRGGLVVTGETSATEKRNPKRSHYIPDVCREMGIPCINLLGLMRREGWRF